MGWRNIEVEGRAFKWKMGHVKLAVRDESGKTHLLDPTHDTIGAEIAVTPHHVANAIRTQMLGLPAKERH